MTLIENLLKSAAGNQWERIGVKQHHGINIPLFSLHSEDSCGIGEFTDLLPLFPWCKQIGLDIIQLLPLNDTGQNASPYSSISAFALNPIHLGLAYMPFMEENRELHAQIRAMQTLHENRVDYKTVREAKETFLRDYYAYAGKKITSLNKFHQFTLDNEWLYPYALFKVLKIENHWKSFSEWDPLFRDINQDVYQQLLTHYVSEISYHIFVQYLCFEQLHEVKEAAEQHGVFLKGDIPILLDRESTDVWFHHRLFNLQYCAGAPPDMFSVEGQNWGSPTYKWDVIALEDYIWWMERLKVAAYLYHLYRLDHVVGFFRIWEIPLGKSGAEGKYFPEDKSHYVSQGDIILRRLLKEKTMLPIAEDLGNVPLEVRNVLENLGICGTKVMRWERNWDSDKSFIPYDHYPQISMSTVSTHDSDTLKLWWKHSPEEVKDFCAFKGWTYEPELKADHLQEILRDSHHTNSLFHINLLQEYLALVPNMTWPDIEDERINVPGIVSDRNWTYRFRPSVEEIVSHSNLREIMKNMVGL